MRFTLGKGTRAAKRAVKSNGSKMTCTNTLILRSAGMRESGDVRGAIIVTAFQLIAVNESRITSIAATGEQEPPRKSRIVFFDELVKRRSFRSMALIK